MTARKFPIEAGQIMMFARAIGDGNPVYYAGEDLVTDREQVIAPPTFVEASIHYDGSFPYRPRIGEQWFGSATKSSSGPPPAAAAGPGTSFHAETHLEYFGLLHPGDLLDVQERPGESWEKAGSRGGRLLFDSYIAEFLRDGTLLVRSTTVVVTTEAKIDPGVATGSPGSGAAADASSDAAAGGRATGVLSLLEPIAYPIPALSAGDVRVGTKREQVLVENLTRAQILMYAGASGDFSPQHTDELWNTEVAGYPTIFAHGMLTMGMTGRLLTDWFANTALRKFSMRFSRQVWPGDTLAAGAEVTSLTVNGNTALVELSLETTNAAGQVVASGSARLELAA